MSSEIKEKNLEFVEQLSEVSESSIASAASIKRAKAEAEKVRLEFVKKESELLKQKAALEADICVIKQESKVAAAEVEARVLEQDEQEHELPSVYGDKHEEIHNYVQNLHVSEQQTTFISSLSNQQPNFYVSAPSALLLKLQMFLQVSQGFLRSQMSLILYLRQFKVSLIFNHLYCNILCKMTLFHQMLFYTMQCLISHDSCIEKTFFFRDL